MSVKKYKIAKRKISDISSQDLCNTLVSFKDCIRKGDCRSQYLLGKFLICMSNRNCTVRASEGELWISKAAAKGYLRAVDSLLNSLGFSDWYNGRIVTSALAEGIAILIKEGYTGYVFSLCKWCSFIYYCNANDERIIELVEYVLGYGAEQGWLEAVAELVSLYKKIYFKSDCSERKLQCLKKSYELVCNRTAEIEKEYGFKSNILDFSTDYITKILFSENPEKALKILNEKAEANERWAQRKLCSLYSEGILAERNDEIKFKWSSELASSWDSDYYTDTANMFYSGCGTEKDFLRAYEYYGRSVLNTDKLQEHISLLSKTVYVDKAKENKNYYYYINRWSDYNGEYTEHPKGSLYYYTIEDEYEEGTAEYYYESGMNQLLLFDLLNEIPDEEFSDYDFSDDGLILKNAEQKPKEDNELIPKEDTELIPKADTKLILKEAYDYFLKAAEMNYNKAEFEIGIMLSDDNCEFRDKEKAVCWLERAAQHGSAEAAEKLVLMYSDNSESETYYENTVEKCKFLKEYYKNSENSMDKYIYWDNFLFKLNDGRYTLYEQAKSGSITAKIMIGSCCRTYNSEAAAEDSWFREGLDNPDYILREKIPEEDCCHAGAYWFREALRELGYDIV